MIRLTILDLFALLKPLFEYAQNKCYLTVQGVERKRTIKQLVGFICFFVAKTTNRIQSHRLVSNNRYRYFYILDFDFVHCFKPKPDKSQP